MSNVPTTVPGVTPRLPLDACLQPASAGDPPRASRSRIGEPTPYQAARRMVEVAIARFEQATRQLARVEAAEARGKNGPYHPADWGSVVHRARELVSVSEMGLADAIITLDQVAGTDLIPSVERFKPLAVAWKGATYVVFWNPAFELGAISVRALRSGRTIDLNAEEGGRS